MRKILSFIFRLSVSLLIIGYTLKLISEKYGGLGNGMNHFISVFSNASLLWIIPAFTLHFIGMGLMSLRWRTLLLAQGVNAGFGKLYSFNLMAAFFNNFLPSTIGGDLIKAVESKRIVGDHTRSVMVIVIERLTGLLALAVIALFAFVAKGAGSGSEESGNPEIFALLIALGIVTVAILSHPKVSGKVVRFLKKILPEKPAEIIERGAEAISVYYNYPRHLFLSIFISTLFQFNMVLYYYFISLGLGMNPGFIDFMTKAPMLIFLLMTVPAVNGIGVRTAVFGGLMKFPMATALAVEAVDIGMRMCLGLLGGIVFLVYRRTSGVAATEKK